MNDYTGLYFVLGAGLFFLAWGILIAVKLWKDGKK